MRAHPLREGFPVEMASGDVNDRLLRLIDCGAQLEAIQCEKHIERGVHDSLVSVKERMILNQGEPERGCFGRKVGVELLPTEGHARLRDCRLQGPQISNPSGAARLCYDPTVQFQYLTQREVPHSGQ